MKYLWTEDTGAGLHFWKLINQLFFDDEFVVESKGSNRSNHMSKRKAAKQRFCEWGVRCILHNYWLKFVS